MKFLLSRLSLCLALLSGGKPSEAAVTFIHGGAQEANELTDGNIGEDQSITTRFLSEGRRLLPVEGVFTALVIRTTDSAGNEPPTSAEKASDVWFGTHDLEFAENQNSMSSLYDQCSGGKLTFVPAIGNNVIDGVFEFTVNQDLTGMGINDAGNFIIREFLKVNAELGLQFDAYSVICPNGVQGSGGIAGIGGSHQFYGGGAERSLDVVVHEFGHNIGMHHSGVPNEGQYDDNSCMMGCCAGAQQMCFNSAKSWYTGWYSEAGKEGHEDLNDLRTAGQWWKGKLVGIDDYLNGIFDENEHRVIVRTPGLYTMFNRAKGVNAGVKAYRNQVVVVEQWSSRSKSNVLATLDEDTNSFTYSSEYYDFDVNEHRVIVRTPGLYTMFNRAKGVNAGVKAYRNQVVVVQQWGKGGNSGVLATLDEDTNSFTYSSEYYDFDVNFKVCEIAYPPIITGPQIIGGTASQSTTTHGAEASRAIDGNMDNTWAGNSVTHTEGDDDFDPWWRLVLDSEEVLGHIRVYNRGDCCGDRLNNAFIELFDDSGTLVFSINMGTAETVKEVFLASSYNVKEVLIRLQGNKVLSLAEVQLFAPSEDPHARQPDYAEVIAYVSDRSNPIDITCNHTMEPTSSALPSSEPTASLLPTRYVAIPRDVTLVRDNSLCVFQHNPSNHPDRFKCMLQRTTISTEPGGDGNDDVDLQGVNGCVIVVQPVTWAYNGNAFVFESDEDLDTINACFAAGTRITELGPTFSPSMAPANDFTPDPTKALTESPSKAPTDVPTGIPTEVPTESPTKSPTDSPADIPTEVPTESPTKSPTDSPTGMPTQVPTESPTKSPTDSPADIPTKVPTESPTKSPTIAPSQPVIPEDVLLLRDGSDCVFQHNPSNHVDRFKCMLQPTTFSNQPGGDGNDAVALQGEDGCVIIVQPITWAWDGDAFVFESDEDLNAINACFAPGVLISLGPMTPSPSIAPSDQSVIPKDVLLLRDGSDCVFQHNPSNHVDRFKCMLQPTTFSNQPGGDG
eukprot:CAMPEP_0194260402 /NCGR_PEP_ID=MMETSP0158-20130606/45493_1 /TAXON_ID=33649 /ORGANISM="Thalassionema nitzschioides, Strain L26-B" /LENGTH=1009 /DNA_ID=CAMNT_0039000491 /DNA_START=103 /DNA_END=3129 /DNA_ORIENTATION=-